MREVEVFLDWRPISTTAFQPSAHFVKVDGDTRDLLDLRLSEARFDSRWARKVMPSVAYAMRTDGLFLFKVEFDRGADPDLTNSDRLALVCIVSNFIKSLNGHFHFFDRRSQLLETARDRSPLFKYPVQIDFPETDVSNVDAFLASVAQDADKFAQLQQRPPTKLTPVEPGQHPKSAVLVLRSRYASRLDRTFDWIARLRGRTFFGFRIFHRVAFVTFLYLIILFGYSIHRVGMEADLSRLEKAWMTLSGFVSAIALVAFLRYLTKPIIDYILQQFESFRWLAAMKTAERAGLYRRASKFLRKLVPENWAVFVVLSSPFLFSIREVPDLTLFLKWPKLFEGTPYYESAIKATTAVSIRVVLEEPLRIAKEFSSALFAFAFLPLALLQYSEREYRSRVIQSLDSLVGYLRFANVLDAVIVNFLHAAKSPYPPCYGYHSAIEIAERRLNSEVMKRTRNGIVFTFLWLAYGTYLYRVFIAP